ncbi:FAD-dependent thymidylate synthase [uncultured Treponema sp.]|uniref:FAD-dependent thymidylate synthase n=1 Tax=uncultured Treponema sp. TaxID=162155 RepID=UPI000E8F96F3|nr:FAD-dependent thymidylate synthase [uncultured Treponema sp.]HAZ96208.1 FAD-dependent thymidylate synthase [Treponema sp.]
MAHCIVPAAEEILDKEFQVLDKGFVRLVDYYGSDSRIVQAARVSYGEGTKTVSQDGALIDYLLRHQHTSPFEQVVFTFHLKMPIFVARQWVRHRMGRMNEVSGRYSIMKDEFYVPENSCISKQSKNNKQGRGDVFEEQQAKEFQAEFIEGQQKAYEVYKDMVEKGIAREIARINLPLALYTEFYWQMDLHNLFHFLKLRLDSHAQYEIRLYAEKILEIIKTVCPMAVSSFENTMEKAVSFNGEEMEALRKILNGEENPIQDEKKLKRFNEKIKTGVQL